MTEDLIKKYCLREDACLDEALKIIDCNQKGFAVITDACEKAVGVLTDGDIRRAFIAGATTKDPVAGYCTKAFTALKASDSFDKAIDIFKDKRIKFLPVIGDDGRLSNILTKEQMHALLLQDISADLSYDFSTLDESIVDTEVFRRPWGFYKTTVYNDFYQAKVISVKPGGKLSLQSHRHREEHWVVVHGKGTVQIDGTFVNVSTGSSVFLPKGCRHRVTNTDAKENLIISEIQIGDYLGEDDIIRYEDIYGRV